MAQHTEISKEKNPQSISRPYRSPRLSVYGSMRTLTAGGTGVKVEDKINQLTKIRP